MCHQWMDEHLGLIVTKFQFSELLNKAWMQVMTPASAIAGFKKAGVYPFNRGANVPSFHPPSAGAKGDDMALKDKGASSEDNGAILLTSSTPLGTASMPPALSLHHL